MIFHRILLAGACCVLALPAARAAGEKTIGVRTLAIGPVDPAEMFMQGAKGYQAVRFSDVQPSAPVRVVFKNPLPVFLPKTGPDGKESYAVAGSAKLPAGARGLLLLCWQSGNTVKFKAIRDDFDSAGAGDWMLVNAADKAVAFKLGKDAKPIRVAPGASRVYRIGAAKNKGAAVTAAIPAGKDGKEWKLFFSTYWPVYADKRCLVLFVSDGEKIRVKRITDKIRKSAR